MEQENTKLPQVGELTIAQISKIMPFGAYCKLLEYNNLEVFLPIKEVSSGWIKNIHEFIHEGQKTVCKVIFYDKERQTIDVSIKKVTPQDSKKKLNNFNLEKRLKSLVLQAVKGAGPASGEQERQSNLLLSLADFKNSYTELVRNAAENSKEFQNCKLNKKVKENILGLLEASKKKKKYIVSYVMTMKTFNTKSGASELRSIVSAIKEKGVDVTYVSAPKYHLTAEGKDYSDAEGKINMAAELVASKLKKGTVEITKEKLKKEKEGILSTF